jgi:hypothetical protein
VTAEEINLAAETADKTPDTSHVIGWVVMQLALAGDGVAFFVLSGSGFKGENPALYATFDAAEQAIASQVGKGWLVLPVLDQGDSG